jgi:hypothetical protein
MQYLLLFCLTVSAYANNTLSIQTELGDGMLNHILQNTPINWPSKRTMRLNQHFRHNSNIQGWVKKIDFRFPTRPLDHISRNNESVNLDWDFSSLSAKINVKVRFKFKKLGVSLTHDEYFDISVKGITPSTTELAYSTENNLLNFDLLANRGFEVQKLEVKPSAGSSELLRFIFNNVLSKRKLAKMLKKEANKQLFNWANNNDFISLVENTLNDQIRKLTRIKMRIGDIEDAFLFQLSQLSMDQDNMGFAFNVPNLPVRLHSCASDITERQGEVGLGKNILENIFNHYAFSSSLKTPLMCFNNKKGVPVSFKVLGKKIRLNYSLRPQRFPVFNYEPESNRITLSMSFKTRIEGVGYPKLIFTNPEFINTVSASFRIIADQSGLKLLFDQVKLHKLPTKLRLKWNKYFPKLPLPLNRVRSFLSKVITRQIKRRYGEIKLINSKVPFIGKTYLEIMGYNQSVDAHVVNFQLRKN